MNVVESVQIFSTHVPILTCSSVVYIHPHIHDTPTHTQTSIHAHRHYVVHTPYCTRHSTPLQCLLFTPQSMSLPRCPSGVLLRWLWPLPVLLVQWCTTTPKLTANSRRPLATLSFASTFQITSLPPLKKPSKIRSNGLT